MNIAFIGEKVGQAMDEVPVCWVVGAVIERGMREEV